MNIFAQISRHEANLNRLRQFVLNHPEVEKLSPTLVMSGEFRPYIRFLNVPQEAAMEFCSSHRDGQWKWSDCDSDPREFEGTIDGVTIAIVVPKKKMVPMFLATA